MDGLIIDSVTGRFFTDAPTARGSQLPWSRSRLRAALRELPVTEEQILRWLLGLGCAALSEEEVAARMNMSLSQIWRIANRGLAEIGFMLLTEEAA